MDPKPKKIMSRKYLEFVKSLPCLVCRGSPAEPHHLKARGWGSAKRVDFFAVPLDREHHTELEQIGMQKFCEKYQVELWRECARMVVAFFLGIPVEEI